MSMQSLGKINLDAIIYKQMKIELLITLPFSLEVASSKPTRINNTYLAKNNCKEWQSM
jgi:hypothetical protein